MTRLVLGISCLSLVIFLWSTNSRICPFYAPINTLRPIHEIDVYMSIHGNYINNNNGNNGIHGNNCNNGNNANYDGNDNSDNNCKSNSGNNGNNGNNNDGNVSNHNH